MPLSSWTQNLKLTRSAVVQVFMALAFAAPAGAEIITVQDMLRGTNSTPTQCSAVHDAVWVTVKDHSFCMRYYLATSGGDERRAVVFLQGDRLGVLNLRTGTFAVPPGEKDVDTDELMKVALALNRQTKLPAIYLARVGLEGSSGDHRVRHSVLELDVTNAALEAIKQKHHFEEFHLLGQSGGAHLVAGLLAKRQDIGCAVIGSGPLAPVKRTRQDSSLESYNPLSELAAIKNNQLARIMVVTDPADKKVSGQVQSNFVQMLRQAGRQADQFIVETTDENRHGVLGYSRIVLSGCLRGAGTEAIAELVAKAVQLRVAAAKPKVERRNDGSTDSTPASGQAHGHATGTETSPRDIPARTTPPRGGAPETTHKEAIPGE
jgi:hypothetical protein